MERCRYNEVATKGNYILCPYCQFEMKEGLITNTQTFKCIRDGGVCFERVFGYGNWNK